MNLLNNYIRYRTILAEKKEIFDLLDKVDSYENDNFPPHCLKNVVMLLPWIYPSFGGITSAMRILVFLQQNNCKVTIAVMDEKGVKEAKANAIKCMPEFHGEVKPASECIKDKYDVCIATTWQSAYLAQKFSGYKVYFVQDYEPEFFETNDFSLLAKETYSFGYHIISLGKWNLDKIKCNVKDINGKLDYIDFPYSPSEYHYIPRNYLSYKDKKTIKIACYIRYNGRRIPYIREYMLSKLKNILEDKGFRIEIYFFGTNKHLIFNCGTNLGKLTRKELFNLYNNCDFGMVASMTNISLVPYEMLASGLPVIEFKQGSYSYFLGDDTALLVDFNYKTLCDGLCDLLDNPERLEKMHIRALEKLENLSWDKSCNQFLNILKDVMV